MLFTLQIDIGMNSYLSFQEHLKKNLAPREYLSFFFNAFNFIACYTLHHIIITLWLKFICIKVISTCHVIDL
jgi:hypothetical protein